MGFSQRGYIKKYRTLLPYILLILSPLDHLAGQDSIPELIISVSSRSKTINQVLDDIALQTGYHFTFNSGLIDGKQKVDFVVENKTLVYMLDSLLGDSLLAYRIIDRNIVIYKRNLETPSPISAEIKRFYIRGRIVDSRSGKPLPYSTIALYGTSLGSVTNADGEFSFKIPDEISDPLLVISYMGYKQKLQAVTFPLEEELIIPLVKETIPLQEVIIRFTDPELLLTEAMRRIDQNYLNDHSTMTAYYRESVKRNEHCMIYSEAVLDVAKSPYDKSAFGDRVMIQKGRKIVDVTTEDTIIIKLRSGIYTSLSLDVVKDRPDFLATDFLDRYDLEYADLMTYGDRLVYVINFNQKEHIQTLLFRGQIYLDQESLALVATDFEYDPNLIHREPNIFLVSRSPKIRIRPTMAKYHVDYRRSGERYHVSQVRGEVGMKVRKRRQWISSSYTISIEMAITDVIPAQRLRISAAQRLDPDQVLSEEPFQFDPDFWGIHNTIQPEASLMESIKRLQPDFQELRE